MKNTLTLSTVLSLMLCAPLAQANIINGDFASCDFSGWQQDSDGLGSPENTTDFTIENNAGNCSAIILVDDGASASAMFVNTLFTELDLTASPTDTMTLSFDWAFSGTDGDPVFGDYFSVFLSGPDGGIFGRDGQPGFLIEPVSSYGSDSFSTIIDPTLYNSVGWTLEFQVFDAFSPTDDALFSVLNIDNVQLSTQGVDVSAPATGILMSLSLMLAYRGRRHFNGSEKV